MIADVLMNLFDSDLPADSTAIDPLVAPEEVFAEPDPLDAIAQEQPVDIETNLPDFLNAEANSDFVSGGPGVIDNEEVDAAELELPYITEVDSNGSDLSSAEGADAILDAIEANKLADLTEAADASPLGDSAPTIGDNLGESLFDPIFDFISDIWDRFFQPFFDPGDIVRSADFSPDGSMDTKNNLVVVGDVASDINFISEQTHGSCSLMAQEQFVHRLTGQPIPEEYLEWQAEKWGVYHPDLGTDLKGQEMILEHFNIPYDRDYNPEMDDIVRSMSKGNDVLIGVDAREFYQDPSIPPGSGHTVALVGRGLDPETGDLKGFYVTDSNYPGAVHFIPTEQLEASWTGFDMISIPENLAA